MNSTRAIVKVEKPQRAAPRVRIAKPLSNKPASGGWYSTKYGAPLEEPIEGKTKISRLFGVIGRALKRQATDTKSYFSGVADILSDKELTVVDMTGVREPEVFSISQNGKEAQL